ncbi:GNAT family N-acetyltransferase [Pseudooceanicola sp. GBMRC 2024]|uniref:GNAT family N-acetyltransferase n=1 Tax=Pseudooceanicola albus TaxID=2692189 RepID=A0A6L7G2P7_9RHOB|nr:GNAT family N-acetyltransferase [Pseudooceanicola albus]MXN17727.1 GNAT family N-acetyltransferase [Pseudooceanicola albus]
MKIVKLAAAPACGAECASWLYREWGHRRHGSTLSQATERFAARARTEGLPMAFVAFAESRPVGTASLLATEDPADSCGPWLASLFVLPRMRGKGVAAQSIRTLEGEARHQGFDRLWLSASAPGMYAKFGYRMSEARKHGEPVMTKRLG